MLGVMVHACNPALGEVMGGYLGFTGQTVLPIWRTPNNGEVTSQKDICWWHLRNDACGHMNPHTHKYTWIGTHTKDTHLGVFVT